MKYLHFYLTIIISTLFAFMSLGAEKVASSWAGGDGTEENPYQISDISHLRKLAEDCKNGISYKNKYFCLINDIRDNDQVIDEEGNLIEDVRSLRIWSQPIGPSIESPFQGNIDGRNHTISGIYTGREWDENFGYVPLYNDGANSNGLFGYIESAVIKNLRIRDCFYYSLVMWPKNSIINNCINWATSFYSIATGGSAGNVRIINCGNYGVAYGAGISCGHSAFFTLINCFNFGEIRQKEWTSGGICANGEIILNCLNVGAIKNSGYPTGGICRWNIGKGSKDTDITLGNCVNYGTMLPFGDENNAGISFYLGNKNGYKACIKNIYWLETSATNYSGKVEKKFVLKGDALKMTEEEMKDASFLETLNENARNLGSQCCGWKRGKNGFPILEIIDEEVSSIEEVETYDEEENLSPISYYDIMGIKVSEPQKGMYIKVQGNKSEKVLF